ALKAASKTLRERAEGAAQHPGHARSRMRENILGVPALQIELGPRRQEFETGLRQPQTALARQHGIEAFAQTMQMQDVGSRIGQLRLAQGLRAPVARLLLLRQVDVERSEERRVGKEWRCAVTQGQ